jgi:EF-P beta-lysylation protein EpmB
LQATRQKRPWQDALRDGITDPRELLDLLDLDPVLFGGDRTAHREFRLRVPRGFVARMRRRDPNDPLLLQVLPQASECQTVPGFVEDPVGDAAALSAPGLLQKYQGRALLTVTGACAVNCRYCFRRHFPYAGAGADPVVSPQALAQLRADRSLSEIILSGGDPLVIDDPRLADLVDRLAQIPHLRRLRIHTRLPIVLPERVDEALLDWLGRTRLSPVVVVHANHARELDIEVRRALARLRSAGVTLLNQSVLLCGINDSVPALADLSERLFEAGVLPYYLHMLDRVRGAAHFEVTEARAAKLIDRLAAQLPGYLVPRLVREIPGAPGKTPVPSPLSAGAS